VEDGGIMSLYYLFVLAIWIWLTKTIWRLWRFNRQDPYKNRRQVDIVFAVLVIIWLSASFWYGGGRKYYYDAEVRRLCAIDGGVKIYMKR
jgi:type VI protein secretion system component VasK